MAAANGGAGPGARPGRRWHVALSFAGAQRDYVGQVAEALKARGMRCFYDADEQIELWGKYLAEELSAIYGEQAAAVVVFISADYAGRDWTRLERRAAFSRAVAEAGVYVLPARFDDTPLPGLLSDVVAVDLRRYAPGQFADLVVEKLADLGISPPPPGGAGGVPAGWVGEAEPRSTPAVPQPRILQVGKDVLAVAFSPDGTCLATGHGSRVRIWNLQTGVEIRELRAGPALARAVAFSPDGTRLATASGEVARIWDAATGQRRLQVTHSLTAKLMRTVPELAVGAIFIPVGPIWAVAFSSHGTRLATGGGNTARIWDAATGQQQFQVTHGEPVIARDATAWQRRLQVTHGDTVLAVAFSPDGAWLATGSRNKTARIWDATGQQRLQVAHGEPVLAVAFSPDGTRLATGGGNTARTWDATTGQQQLQVAYGDTMKAVAFSPDGTRLATGSGEAARIWDISGG